MNTSFRTAFWAMCLGLTVPMVLFIGVEMSPGGRAARKSSAAAADYRGSLRSFWAHPELRLAQTAAPSNQAIGKSETAATAGQKRDGAGAAVVGKSPSDRPFPGRWPSDKEDAKVTLGPLE